MPLHRVIISGGGTGGHIFPAVAIANEIKKRYPDADILFVGANGRMEMHKVPEAGYPIKGLDISGLQRNASFSNVLLPLKVLKSVAGAASIIRKHKPEVVIGVGGYASAPVLFAAQMMGIPTLIQEQNGFAGITNKLLGKRAKKICVAYNGMETFFPSGKIVKTGNPVRGEIVEMNASREEALEFFGLDGSKPVVLAIGGSLGALTINRSLEGALKHFRRENVQLLWQTGKSFYQHALNEQFGGIHPHEFIKRMDLAYTAADVIISRAGALSVSELCIVGKPAIFIPSPNVAEDHQSKNAEVLVRAGAALMVKDKEAQRLLWDELHGLLHNADLKATLSQNIRKLAVTNAAERIVNQIEEIC